MVPEPFNPFIVSGQLRFREFLGFNFWFLWRRFKLLILLIFFGGFVYPVFAIAGAFGDAGKAAEGKEWAYFIWPSVVTIMSVAIYFSARKAFANNKLLSQPVRYTFSSQGIEAMGPISSGTCSWEGITGAEENRSLVLLWVSKQQAYMLPKRYFSSASSLQEFRTLLTNQLGHRATLQSGA